MKRVLCWLMIAFGMFVLLGIFIVVKENIKVNRTITDDEGIGKVVLPSQYSAIIQMA